MHDLLNFFFIHKNQCKKKQKKTCIFFYFLFKFKKLRQKQIQRTASIFYF